MTATQDLQRLLASAVGYRPILLQLAAALCWVEASGEPGTLVSLDQRLREAALREGLQAVGWAGSRFRSLS